jgi:hypothetical protein
MSNTWRRRVAHKTQVGYSKVKVTLTGQSRNPWYCSCGRVRSVTVISWGILKLPGGNVKHMKTTLSRTRPRSVTRRSRSLFTGHQLFLETTSPPKPFDIFSGNFTWMICVWPSIKVVQIVPVHCILRSR